MDSKRIIRHYQDIHWPTWEPHEKATLLFVVAGDRILLIRKKRGLGAGKITGPGGKLDPGEDLKTCALRELREEVGLLAEDATLKGDLAFQFSDGYALQVFVFMATSYSGTLMETDEALPLWYPTDAMPFEEMWEDDYLWMPKMLAGEPFQGRFLFDGDKMLGHNF